MPRELDLGEVPLADGLEEPVVADVGVLLGGGQGVSASRQAVAAGRLGGRDGGLHEAVRRVLREERRRAETNKRPEACRFHFRLGEKSFYLKEIPWSLVSRWVVSPLGFLQTTDSLS